MSSSFTTTYIVPALLLNPCIVLHFLNTFMSRLNPGILDASSSPHEWLERFGPMAHSDAYFDLHLNDYLCWGYTILMVFVQIMVFGKVSDNRVQRKAARRERDRSIGMKCDERKIGDMEGVVEETSIDGPRDLLDGTTPRGGNGHASRANEDSTQETSEETSEGEVIV
ncbi:MAG: hypothetical protein M1818_007074 [Claussenomyces sp. TS43310]|nr:MAG: hypothetical protein M1818_007074 [Claussenomyces sp. TS43310]